MRPAFVVGGRDARVVASLSWQGQVWMRARDIHELGATFISLYGSNQHERLSI